MANEIDKRIIEPLEQWIAVLEGELIRLYTMTAHHCGEEVRRELRRTVQSLFGLEEHL